MYMMHKPPPGPFSRSISTYFWLEVIGLLVATHAAAAREGYEECTLRQGTPLIVGGVPFNCSVAWMVSLRNEKDFHICAGSLIEKNVVLTAAHCFENKQRAVSADIGRVKLNDQHDPSFDKHKVLKTIIHEKYNPETNDFDIALAILGSGSDRTLSLLSSSDLCFNTERGCEVKVIGWGYNAEGGSLSEQIQMVDSRSVTKAECAKRYARIGAELSDTMVCAGDIYNGGKDSCNGDSGGPILVKGEQVGLVSWGVGCGRADYPGVYTSVPKLRPWIEQKLQETSLSA